MAAAPPHRSFRRPLSFLALLAFLVPALVAADPPAACAHASGSGGWFWPVGSESYGTMAGWLEPRGASCHVGQDMPANYGHPVYAVGAGTVWKAKADADGYGPGGGPGGVMIIAHRTATGRMFRALYGHLQGLRFKAGDRVAAGAVIAFINGASPTHLHFGIHLGSYYPDDNPYRGHVPMSWPDYGGWVDPVRYLRMHPRVIPYLVPALASRKIMTTTLPVTMGAADGIAYWSQETGDGVEAYACDLTTLERHLLAGEQEFLPFDAKRYVVAKLASPAIGLKVKDRLPLLALTQPHLTPPWGARVRLAGGLTDWEGRPFQGARVRLERHTSLGWTALKSTLTTADGRTSLSWAPPGGTTLRLRFVPPAGATPRYLEAASPTVTVKPHVSLTAAGAAFSVSGHLTPQHPEGPEVVDLELQRYEGDAWVPALTVAANTRDDGERSRYGRTLSLRSRGSWRIRALQAQDAQHAATRSGWRAFTVR